MKIKQLSEMSGLSTHTIRYYEKIHLLQKPNKNTSGHRIYDETDLELINWVACLKNSGMSLQKIKEYAYAHHDNDETKLTEILNVHLTKLQSQQTDIEHYIHVTKQKLIRLKRS